jgi:hypothetical protein
MQTHLRRQLKSKRRLQLKFKQRSENAVNWSRLQIHEANTAFSVALNNFSDLIITSALLLLQWENFLFFFRLRGLNYFWFALLLSLNNRLLRFELGNRFQEIGLHLSAQWVSPVSNSVSEAGPAWRFFCLGKLETYKIYQEWHVWCGNVYLLW